MSPGHANGPCGDTGRAESHATAKQDDLLAEVTRRERQRRVDALRRALTDARRRNDQPSVALLVSWLSDEAKL